MFRHKSVTDIENKKDITKEPDKKQDVVVEDISATSHVTVLEKTELETIKELVEKNLKWSQIIYEQNRKINNKLLWSAIADWFRILLIVVSLILAFWFLPSIFRQFTSTYGNLIGGLSGTNKSSTGQLSIPINSIEQIIKTLPLSPAQQEQLKAIIK